MAPVAPVALPPLICRVLIGTPCFFESTRDSKITKIYRGVANRCHHCHHCHHGSCAQGIIEVDPVGGTTGAGLLGRVLINAGIGRMSE